MDPSEEVTQKLAEFNICPPKDIRIPIRAVSPSGLPSPSHAFLSSSGKAGFQATQSTQASLINNNDKIKDTKSNTAITGPIIAIPERKSSKNFSNPKTNPKALRNISRNIAESLTRNGASKSTSRIANGIIKCREKIRRGVDRILRRDTTASGPGSGPTGLKRWLIEKGKEKERRHDRRALAMCSATRATQRRDALSEGVRKKLGLKREGAILGVIKEEEEENTMMEEDVQMEEDTVMKD